MTIMDKKLLIAKNANFNHSTSGGSGVDWPVIDRGAIFAASGAASDRYVGQYERLHLFMIVSEDVAPAAGNAFSFIMYVHPTSATPSIPYRYYTNFAVGNFRKNGILDFGPIDFTQCRSIGVLWTSSTALTAGKCSLFMATCPPSNNPAMFIINPT